MNFLSLYKIRLLNSRLFWVIIIIILFGERWKLANLCLFWSRGITWYNWTLFIKLKFKVFLLNNLILRKYFDKMISFF